MNHTLITKADGQQEIYAREKLDTSLKHAGASFEARARVIEQIERELREGMTTEDIYQYAFQALKSIEDIPVAARYSIKRAVFDLGPSGYPFESFFAEILRAHGWRTRVEVAMNGRCAPHEVDVLAEKGRVRAGIEVKFHNTAGVVTDVKDALYVHARFEDLKHAPHEHERVTEGWLVTNTRFTRTAIRYGRCAGLTMYGWDYPRHRGIVDMVEQMAGHPLTCLTTLSSGEKQRLLERNIVLCKSIRDNPNMLTGFGIAPSKIASVAHEAKNLCTMIPKKMQAARSIDPDTNSGTAKRATLHLPSHIRE